MVEPPAPGDGRDLPFESIRAVAGDQPIYHYTTPRGLLGIIETRELWATEASGMNDLAEVHQGWDFIRNWLGDQDSDDWVIGYMRDAAGESSNRQDAHPVRTTDGIYLCSASVRADDANQWRLYGAGGRGYAVEIDPRLRLTSVVRGKRPAPGSNPGFLTEAFEHVGISRWYHVLYTDEEKDQALVALLRDAQKRRVDINDNAEDEEDFDVQSQLLRDEILGQLAQLAQLMKSEGFSGEGEVRTIVWDWWNRHRNFRDTPSGIVRYARLTGDPTQNSAGPDSSRIVYDEGAPAGKTLPLRSVWLGPLIHTLNNRGTVKALLADKGFSGCPLKESRIPLRD